MNIAKKVKFKNAGYGWLMIEDSAVGYKHCNGAMPAADDVLCLLLADKDVRRMGREYALKKRQKPYYIDHYTGMSGCTDFYINFVEFFCGEWHIVRRKKLLHISCADKVNEEIPLMYIGDFVELIAYIGKYWMSRKQLFRLSGAKYIRERKPSHETYGRKVTNLFEFERKEKNRGGSNDSR